MEGLKNAGLPTPSVNQIQLHVYCQNRETVKYCEENGIAVMGYCPLIRGRKMDDHKLLELAKRFVAIDTGIKESENLYVF